MEKKILGIAVFLLVILNLQVFCEKDNSPILWTFEPRTDRSVHVYAVICVKKGINSYEFMDIPEEIWIKAVKASEYVSKTPLEHRVQYDSKTDRQTISVIFNEPTPEDYRIEIEFDLMDFMEEKKERVFIFEWYFRSDEKKNHTAVVSLPKGAELLEMKYLEPVKMEEGEQVVLSYEGTSKSSIDFRFQLVFSPSGKDHVKLAKRYEESGNYDLALSYYKRAMSLYGRYTFYMETNPEVLREIRERIFVIQKMQADNAFEEAVEVFEQGEYKKAQSQFEELEPLYRILKDTERESECRELITECERIEKLGEAEKLLEEGKKQYEAEEYGEAKESFVQARNLLKEAGDTEKVSECEEWLGRYHENEIAVVVTALGVVVVLLMVKRQL